MSTNRKNGRAQRVIAHLVANPNGATVRQLIEQLEPTCSQLNMSGTVASLVAGKKLRPLSSARPVVYVATGEAALDKRRDRAPKAAPGLVPEHRASRAVAQVERARPMPRTALVPVDHAKARASEQLAAEVAAWLAGGGQIQHLAPGATSTPLKTHPLHAANDAAWLERQARLARID